MNKENKNKDKRFVLWGQAGQKLPQHIRQVCRERNYNSARMSLLEIYKGETEIQLQNLIQKLSKNGLIYDFAEKDLDLLKSLTINEIVQKIELEFGDLMQCKYDKGDKRQCQSCILVQRVINDLRSRNE